MSNFSMGKVNPLLHRTSPILHFHKEDLHPIATTSWLSGPRRVLKLSEAFLIDL